MISLYLLQIFYLIVKFVAPSSEVAHYVFDMIKQDVFTISGDCKHSGNCCRNVMLYDSNIPLNSLNQWELFKKKFTEFSSFYPITQSSKITQFNCHALTQDNFCSRYDSRPEVCRNYPFSFFNQHGYIYDSCGYYVERNSKKFKLLFPSIRTELNQFSTI